jgi:AraC-like DNA-binding protein
MQVTWYIMENLHANLSVPVLAKGFMVEENALLHAFKVGTGIQLEDFVLRRRIECALRLLKHSAATDGEIAIRIGFGSEPAFQTAFVDYLGVSPREYRQRLLPNQESTGLRPCPRRSHKPALISREESTGPALCKSAV